MAFWGQRERVALGFGPDRLRMLVARGNGSLKPVFSAAAELPEGAVRAGLRAPGLGDAAAVRERLEQLAGEARGKGLLRRRPELVTVLVPDVSVKLAAAPVEGESPGREEGERMARWALGDLLPGDTDEARIDWSVLSDSGRGVAAPGGVDGAEVTPGAGSWLVALGAESALVQDYEDVVERLGWSVGRLLPWTLALAVGAAAEESGRAGADGDRGGEDRRGGGGGAGDATGGDRDGGGLGGRRQRDTGLPAQRLMLCDADGSLACLFEADEVPRFHRAWRARVSAEQLGAELPGLRRYITDRLELGISESWLCGPDENWTRVAEEACRQAGFRTRSFRPDVALMGGLRG